MAPVRSDLRERDAQLAAELAAERAACAEARRTVRRLEAIETLTESLAAATTPPEVCRVLFERGLAAFRPRAGAVSRVVAPGRLEVVYQVGLAPSPVGETYSVDLMVPSAETVRTGQAVFVESRAELRARYPDLAVVSGGLDDETCASLPLVAGNRVVGSIGFALGRAHAFDADERAYLVALARHAAPALERASLYARERAAREDEARSRALLDAILDNAPLGIGFLDRELRFVRVNGVLAETNGITPEAHVGKTPRELLPGLPSDDVEAGWAHVLRTGKPLVDVELSGETPAAPGRTRHWVESWYPVRAGGELLGVGALVREVTQEREAQEFQRNVLGIVSHDLRNPLAAIVATTELLKLGVEPSRLPVLARRIESNAERMARMVNVLADYARVRGRQPIPLRRQPCDLAVICRAVADEVLVAHPGREVRLHGDPGLRGDWDPDRVAQVVANLLSNAFDHGAPGAPVDVAWRPDDGGAVVDVANEGAPIPADAIGRLFQPFRRGDGGDDARVGGLGLGLFIARAIAHAHGGSIDVRSAPGERTTFSLRLPRHP